jgi:hypothetical protein
MSAGLGVSAGSNIIGGELQGWASILEQQAMKDAYRNQIGLQQQYKNQALANLGQRLGSADALTAAQQIGQGASQRQANYATLNNLPLSPITPGSQGRALPQAQLYSNLLGNARANLGGYGDWQFQQGLSDINTQRALNQILSSAKGQASVFPYTMYDAQHSQDTLAMIGAAIQSIGGAAGNYMQYAQSPAGSGSNQQQPFFYDPYTGQVTDYYQGLLDSRNR